MKHGCNVISGLLFRVFICMLFHERQAFVGPAIGIAPPGKNSVDSPKTTLRLVSRRYDETGTDGPPF
jgi:hypothetical protein